ncbi:hypothetical protein FSARC_14806, partial [Fusarium sarcochroum]
MTPAPTGPGSPLIAGAAMSGGDFNDFSDDELGASNLFDFSNSPDTLQTLESLGGTDTKAFLSPQDLTRAPFPDSPNGSYQDSSSESASSKRTTSSTSSKTAMNPVDVLMDDGEIKMEWGNPGFSAFGDDDATFAFGRDHTDSSIDGIYNFADHEDSFLDRTFDFESASSSPEAVNGGGNSVASPQMPMINSHSPNKDATPKRKKSQGHQKAPSQYSVSSAMNALKTTGSREVSPMSNMVMSHDGSPAALFNSPSPNNPVDFSRVINGGLGAQHVWPNKIDVAAQSAPDVLPTPMHFGGQMSQPMSIPQQMSMPTPFNFTGQYALRIMPTPLKSRVETQIPIKMALSPVPPGVTKLHLPAHTISKPKLLAKPTPERSPDMLELYVT